MYRIDLNFPTAVIPCSFVPSREPGKTLCLDERGRSMVVEPNGTQVRWIDPGQDNWDSEWTRGTVLSGFLVYRSASGDDPGVPRAYRMIV